MGQVMGLAMVAGAASLRDVVRAELQVPLVHGHLWDIPVYNVYLFQINLAQAEASFEALTQFGRHKTEFGKI